MNEKQIIEMAEHLLIENNLLNWKFKFDNAKRRFGCCYYSTKTISLSKSMANLNPNEIKNTILHEIAHILTGIGNGHNDNWKAKCIELGVKPERCCAESIKSEKGKYIYYCKNCKKEVPHFRKLRSNVSCGKCCKEYNNNKYSDKYILKLKDVK